MENKCIHINDEGMCEECQGQYDDWVYEQMRDRWVQEQVRK